MRGLRLPVSLEAIDFTDEEGSLVGLLGSWALAGTLTPEILRAPRGGRDALASGLARVGLTEHGLAQARRDPATLAGYLELHIEQGPVLEREGIDIGVVTAIAGSRSFRLSFDGERRHAGTTPMGARKDAALGAARFVVAVEQTVSGLPGCVATVGDIAIEPGAFNVVPGGRGWRSSSAPPSCRCSKRSRRRCSPPQLARRAPRGSRSASSRSVAGSRQRSTARCVAQSPRRLAPSV